MGGEMLHSCPVSVEYAEYSMGEWSVQAAEVFLRLDDKRHAR